MSKFDDFDFSVIVWCFAMTPIGLFMLWYEGSVLQYNIAKQAGFDPISTTVILSVLGTFFYLIVKR